MESRLDPPCVRVNRKYVYLVSKSLKQSATPKPDALRTFVAVARRGSPVDRPVRSWAERQRSGGGGAVGCDALVARCGEPISAGSAQIRWRYRNWCVRAWSISVSRASHAQRRPCSLKRCWWSPLCWSAPKTIRLHDRRNLWTLLTCEFRGGRAWRDLVADARGAVKCAGCNPAARRYLADPQCATADDRCVESGRGDFCGDRERVCEHAVRRRAETPSAGWLFEPVVKGVYRKIPTDRCVADKELYAFNPTDADIAACDERVEGIELFPQVRRGVTVGD